MVFRDDPRPRNDFDSSDDDDEERTENLTTLQIDWLDLSFVGCCAELVGICPLPGCKFRDVKRNISCDLDFLKKQDVQHIFNLCSSHELTRYRIPKLLENYECLGFRVHHFPCDDDGIPTVADCLAIVRILKKCIENGIKAVLHCYDGLGRSCVVAAALMMVLEDSLTAEHVLKKLRQLKGPGAIQTVKQYNFVNDFREIKRKHDLNWGSNETTLETHPRSASR